MDARTLSWSTEVDHGHTHGHLVFEINLDTLYATVTGVATTHGSTFRFEAGPMPVDPNDWMPLARLTPVPDRRVDATQAECVRVEDLVWESRTHALRAALAAQRLVRT